MLISFSLICSRRGRDVLEKMSFKGRQTCMPYQWQSKLFDFTFSECHVSPYHRRNEGEAVFIVLQKCVMRANSDGGVHSKNQEEEENILEQSRFVPNIHFNWQHLSPTHFVASNEPLTVNRRTYRSIYNQSRALLLTLYLPSLRRPPQPQTSFTITELQSIGLKGYTESLFRLLFHSNLGISDLSHTSIYLFYLPSSTLVPAPMSAPSKATPHPPTPTKERIQSLL